MPIGVYKRVKIRSDSMISTIKDKAIDFLTNTNFSHSEIGEMLGCSRGPIFNIYKELKKSSFKRKNIRIKYLGNCKWCTKEVILKKSTTRPNRGKFCSKECYRQWQKSEENKGKNNPSYIDGGRHETYLNALRKSDEWKVWRDKVFERDNYTCQMCSERGIEMHPHHIKQKCDFPELIFVVENGITLCKDCHRSKGVHSYRSNLYKMFLEKVKEKTLV